MRALIVGTTAIALSLASTVYAKPMTCVFQQREQCQPGKPCVTVAATTWVKLDLSERHYARCDAKGCDKYEALMGRSGIWAIIDIPGRGFSAKLNESGLFIEIATINDVVLVSYGACTYDK